mmetsp:Transcript_87819/g.256695  ORF Transcript_87819/g.256695 Transcript_87819/m.256695 type:complete len:224 (+) Transcript_87819:95-766(+)
MQRPPNRQLDSQIRRRHVADIVVGILDLERIGLQLFQYLHGLGPVTQGQKRRLQLLVVQRHGQRHVRVHPGDALPQGVVQRAVLALSDGGATSHKRVHCGRDVGVGVQNGGGPLLELFQDGHGLRDLEAQQARRERLEVQLAREGHVGVHPAHPLPQPVLGVAQVPRADGGGRVDQRSRGHLLLYPRGGALDPGVGVADGGDVVLKLHQNVDGLAQVQDEEIG